MASKSYNDLINMQRCKEPVQTYYKSKKKMAIARKKRRILKANLKLSDDIHLANTARPKDEMNYPFMGLC